MSGTVSAVPFLFFRGDLTQRALRERALGLHSGQAADGKKRKKRRARWKILSEVEVEVLKPSLSDGFRMTNFLILLGWRVMGKEF